MADDSAAPRTDRADAFDDSRTAAGPVIVNHISAEIGARIAAHPSRPRVIDMVDTDAPWDIPEGAEILMTRALPAWRKAPEAPPPAVDSLRWVQTMSAGIEIYPDWLSTGRRLSNGRGIAAVAIAEYVLAALLRVEKRLDGIAAHSPADWTHTGAGGLSGKTLGLIGYGAIGQEIARRAAAFDMRVLAVRRGAWDSADAYARPCADAATLLPLCDHLVLAAPLTPETHHLLGRDLLALARPGLHVINVGRGRLVDQDALIEALDAGRISAATLDVTTPEPLPEGHPLYGRKDVLITPHISWIDGRFFDRFVDKFTTNYEAYLAGAPLIDVVDKGRGY